MEEPGFFAAKRVCILGLGLMGGSLALALRGKCATVMAVDPHPPSRDLALEWGIVDQVSAQPEGLLPQADLLVLAAPVRAILGLLRQLPSLHPGQATVIDFGSTKVEIMAAMAALPGRFDPLGGHPMCGKERASLQYADSDLFQGATFAFTPLPRTSPHARQIGDQLALAVGARPLWLDAETHDRWVAASSHLPYLVASALAAVTPPEVAPLVSTGYRSTARLALSEREMMLDILSTNRQNILGSLRTYQRQLAALQLALADDDLNTLRALLEQGARQHTEILQVEEGHP